MGFEHEIKGTGICAFVIVNPEYESRDHEELAIELKIQVRKAIGPFAAPDRVQISTGLPKTRSGKIMRRILRSIANGAYDELGDVTTLADPQVVEELVANHRQES